MAGSWIPGGELLADRQRKPAAIGVDLAAATPDDLERLLTLPAWPAICARLAGVGLHCPPTLAARWTAAGGVLANASDCCRVAAAWPEKLADETRWVAGDWYLAPPPKPNPNQLAWRAVALHLLQLVAADAETHALEEIFRREPALSYQLLRLVNSPGVGGGRRVNSFSQAIMILGRQALRRWLNLLLFAARKDDLRSPMLLARAALRARRMELIEKVRGGDRVAQEKAFIAGMFSLLGVLFGAPLGEVLQPLRLSPDLEAGLLRGEGALGDGLALALRLEAAPGADWAALLERLELAPEAVLALAYEALDWVIDVLDETAGGSDG